LKEKAIWQRPWFWILCVFSFMFFIMLFFILSRWFLLHIWSSFWPHQKTSPEVDAAIISAIASSFSAIATVVATTWITYVINKQTQEITKEQGRVFLNERLLKERAERIPELLALLNKMEHEVNSAINRFSKDLKDGPYTIDLITEEIRGFRKPYIYNPCIDIDEILSRNQVFYPNALNEKIYAIIDHYERYDSLAKFRVNHAIKENEAEEMIKVMNDYHAIVKDAIHFIKYELGSDI
jgi:hypothetical protein